MLVVLAGSSYIQCQEAAESNKVSHEDQKVSAVNLVANPKILVESLRPLVQQRTGDPYSDSKSVLSIEGGRRLYEIKGR
jgi:hypothetical protein